MKLWHISQDNIGGYDTYDSAVVAAETAEVAATIHPSGGKKIPKSDEIFWGDWTNDPLDVKVKLLGDAVPETKEGVICASFNAG